MVASELLRKDEFSSGWQTWLNKFGDFSKWCAGGRGDARPLHQDDDPRWGDEDAREQGRHPADPRASIRTLVRDADDTGVRYGGPLRVADHLSWREEEKRAFLFALEREKAGVERGSARVPILSPIFPESLKWRGPKDLEKSR